MNGHVLKWDRLLGFLLIGSSYCLSFFRFLLHRAVLSIGDLCPVERKNPGAAVVLGPAFLS